MKKIILIIFIVLLLCGCEYGEGRINKNHNQLNELYVDYDRETCVEYIEYNGIKKGGLSVRYNADGSIKLNQECLER